MSKQFERGSEWRKWDLHVHTPLSLYQQYGGDTDEAWEQFFDELENLPEEFSVIGINDYFLIDGYRRVLDAQAAGRLENIDLILPVIELRIDKFAGTDSAFKRINYHVIFSDELSPDTIEQQFINALSSSYKLSAEYEEKDIEWDGVITRESLIELGEAIIASTPEKLRKELPGPLQVGFSNLCVPLAEIKKVLHRIRFEGKILTAVGKSEWSSMRWDGAGVAEKKNVISSVDLVFTASSSPAGYDLSRASLSDAQVNDHLIDCSDAHHFSDSGEHTSIGNCSTWIKANPTFQGLRYATKLFEERICVADLPPKLAHVRQNTTKFIDRLAVTKSNDSDLDEIWFDIDIPLNHDLVAIIGGKGNGKSALTDILALGAQTKRGSFSFLNADKFRDKNKKASHFSATLRWKSNESKDFVLSDNTQSHDVERVRYVPQTFFNTVTNETTVREGSPLDTEIRSVIFSHIDDTERLGCDSLNELIRSRTASIRLSLQNARKELSETNQEIEVLEEELSDTTLRRIEERIEEKKRELEEHDENKPAGVDPPVESTDLSKEIEKLRDQLEELSEEVSETRDTLSTLRTKSARVKNVKESLQEEHSQFNVTLASLQQSLEKLHIELDLSEIAKFELDVSELDIELSSLANKVKGCEAKLDVSDEESLISREKAQEELLKKKEGDLDKEQKAYQTYIAASKQWAKRREKIVGNKKTSGSLKHLQHKKTLIEDELPGRHADLLEVRETRSRAIHQKIIALQNVYQELSHPVQDAIGEQEVLHDRYELDFNSVITDSGFASLFLELIHRNRSGSFYGERGLEYIENATKSHNFDDSDDAIAFATDITERLNKNYQDSEKDNDVTSQLRDGKNPSQVYDLIFGFEYLEPQYELRLDGKSLRQLSPGQRGVLLLIFYLLLDKSEYPLIVDQPEENLDPGSVFDLLVPIIKEAKKRRQIFIVTHSPNLAICCDAEQIVHADIDLKDGNRVTYKCGAIENSEHNQLALDILEGSLPAFKSRMDAYLGLD